MLTDEEAREIFTLYEEKILEATNLGLTQFIFKYKDKFYISQWSKNNWYYPERIKLL